MELKGKKILILVETFYNEFEFWYPFYRLKEAGAQVTVVGSGSADVYKSKTGLPVKVDTTAGNISVADYDGVVIPGGYAPDHMRRYPAMVGLVKGFAEAGKLVAAICHAGWMLVSADIIRGRTVTSYFSIKDDLVNAGGNWVDKEVVVDDRLVTSRTPDDLPAFMRAIIGVLGGDRP
ncbi:type 1 glutamine amidotransferase domain-containing protein [uncultured Desulfosarcina sp.]|uniref:type 1 glutamine amidotransferase domain-containing protein n=1 Tax=uncultured Desulfosarcina sp. TaxID=218289 RepID=UPI0029C7E7FB|nr:type 1 glutamine amidotransferase domain-containing protein [uncultured Desulfosarcina sp.]